MCVSRNTVCVVGTKVVVEMRKGWGEQLRRKRVELGLRQEQVAQIADLAPSTVCRIEAGNSGLEGFARVARVLNVVLEVAA